MISFKSKITQTLLKHFMLHDKDEMYINEMARRFKLDSGNLTRKLLELEEEGILKSRPIGDQRHYSLNKSFPLIREYKNIVMKTMGIEKVLSDALKGIRGIKKALIFGSYAKNKMDQSSDIDLLVVGGHNNVELQKKIAKVQRPIDREINLISVTSKEYANKKGKDDLFRSISRNPKIDLI